MSPSLVQYAHFLPSCWRRTSNAVERGNRRYRKMQKTVYFVHTRKHMDRRIPLDLLRDAQAEGRNRTTRTPPFGKNRIMHHPVAMTQSQFFVIVQGAVRSGDAGRAAIALLRNCSSSVLITPR
jgi:hypothetical protein